MSYQYDGKNYNLRERRFCDSEVSIRYRRLSCRDIRNTTVACIFGIRLLTSWSCCTTRTSCSERHGRIISPISGQRLSLIYPGRCRLKKHLVITSIVTLITSSATCLAVASPKQPSSKVWANFVNESGWQNKGIAYLTGLVNPNYGFGGLDGAIHLAEDYRNATEVVPFAVIFSILTGVVTGLFFCRGHDVLPWRYRSSPCHVNRVRM